MTLFRNLLWPLLLVLAWGFPWESARAEESLADLLETGPAERAGSRERAALAEEWRSRENRRAAEARRWAARRGLPARVERPDGRVVELIEVRDGHPLYFGTHNRNAAISIAADELWAPPFSVDASGFAVGMWDGGIPRATHVEFGGRVTVMDDAPVINHATHVAGTLAAAGLNPAVRGIAPAVRIEARDWNNDKSEMTAVAATRPGEPGSLSVSNHSYGVLAGWSETGQASPKWEWRGGSGAALEQAFGRYNTNARDSDALAAAAPYFLMVRSGGNDRLDNPAPGDPVSPAPGAAVVPYDPAVHPPGDGLYRDGYDTLSFDAVAKNVLTVGSVHDAVLFNAGPRETANATMTLHSSWGPADDGRVKPDLVANGQSVNSTTSFRDDSYGFLTGTSMAVPSASGAAIQLIALFDQLFPGQAMLASTVKGVLIHTADDLGNPGPDYRFGWGLINAGAAARHIRQYAETPGALNLMEDRLQGGGPVKTYPFVWDGVSPIRATLSWTDPAGQATHAHDNRARRLVNNLDLRVIGPDGTAWKPFVMPFAGNWDPALYDAPAVTGQNDVDNVEQVLIANPGLPGLYQAVVSHSGNLSGGAQRFSLMLSGAGPATPPADAEIAGAVFGERAGDGLPLTVTGKHFLLGSTARLTRDGFQPREAYAVEAMGDGLRCRVDAAGMRPGYWNLEVTGPDGVTTAKERAVWLSGLLWEEDFEDDVTAWTFATDGADAGWALDSGFAHTGGNSIFAPAHADANVADMISPEVFLPGEAERWFLLFWHQYEWTGSGGGGVLEFSLNGGPWEHAGNPGSGALFRLGGYNGALSESGPLGSAAAWIGDTGGGFFPVLVEFVERERFADGELRLRWRAVSGNGADGGGWRVDDVSLHQDAVAGLPPVLLKPAGAEPVPVTGVTVELEAEATSFSGDGYLEYNWTAEGDAGSPPVEIATPNSPETMALFSGAGEYLFTVTVKNAEGLSIQSEVAVSVAETPTAMEVTPLDARVPTGETVALIATVRDQFGNAIFAAQPVFSAGGGGTVDAYGNFLAETAGGPFPITAEWEGLTETVWVEVPATTFDQWVTLYFTPGEIEAGMAAETADPDRDGVKNLMEYALGTAPRVPGVAPLVMTRGENGVVLVFQRPADLSDLNYQVEVSTDLQTWSEVEEPVVTGGHPETVRAEVPWSGAETPALFLRLRVERVPGN